MMDETLRMVRRIERAHRCLSRCNRLTIRGLGEEALLSQMCELAVREAGYRLAWVAYLDEATRVVRHVAQSGYEDGYLDSIHVMADDSELGRGPTGTAIRTGEMSVLRDIHTDPAYAAWREQAEKRGYRSSVALPLKDGDVTFGALNLYASEPDAFDAAELELLDEMAADLSHGIFCARGKARLSALEAALRRNDRLDVVGRVVASIAHDVNNLLSVIGFAVVELAESPEQAPARSKEIQDALERAAMLNRELLTFARRAPTNPTVFPIDASVSKLWQVLRRGLPADAELRVDCADWQVRMDLSSLDRVLTNLIVNARDAVASKGTVTLTTARRELRHPLPSALVELSPGEYVCITVSDTGVGMTDEALSHVFEPLFTTKGDKGHGLGLATVFGLVRQSGGAIAVTSTEGKGTSFEVLLPRADEGAAASS